MGMTGARQGSAEFGAGRTEAGRLPTVERVPNGAAIEAGLPRLDPTFVWLRPNPAKLRSTGIDLDRRLGSSRGKVGGTIEVTGTEPPAGRTGGACRDDTLGAGGGGKATLLAAAGRT